MLHSGPIVYGVIRMNPITGFNKLGIWNEELEIEDCDSSNQQVNK